MKDINDIDEIKFVTRKFSDLFYSYLKRSMYFRDFRKSAYKIHSSVNQLYGGLNYGYHLDCAVDFLINELKDCSDYSLNEISKRLNVKNDPKVCPSKLALICAMFHHDIIEDARMTYNDVVEHFKQFEFLNGNDIYGKNEKCQAVIAADLVYALTDLKGKTREEREGDEYWKLIRETPGASLLKCCDIMANSEYSKMNGSRMFKKYKKEIETLFDKVNVNELTEYGINELKSR